MERQWVGNPRHKSHKLIKVYDEWRYINKVNGVCNWRELLFHLSQQLYQNGYLFNVHIINTGIATGTEQLTFFTHARSIRGFVMKFRWYFIGVGIILPELYRPPIVRFALALIGYHPSNVIILGGGKLSISSFISTGYNGLKHWNLNH